MDKCCGTCKWFKPHEYTKKSLCRYPLPVWLDLALFLKLVGGSYLREISAPTTDCPCYAAKGDGDE